MPNYRQRYFAPERALCKGTQTWSDLCSAVTTAGFRGVVKPSHLGADLEHAE